MSFDVDYGPYTGHPSDPRYNDSADVARDAWDCDLTYIEKLDGDTINDILYSLEHGKPDEAKKELAKALNQAWDALCKQQEAA